jgi:hypothetical protein
MFDDIPVCAARSGRVNSRWRAMVGYRMVCSGSNACNDYRLLYPVQYNNTVDEFKQMWLV